MNKKSMLVIGILLLSLSVSAQEKSQQESLPAEVLNASIQDLNGKIFRLAESKGEIRIILLWAAWCGPCRYAVEGLNKLSGIYATRNVEIIGLTLDDPVKDIKGFRNFIRSTKIRFKIGWADEKLGKAIFTGHSGVIPHSLLVTANGEVLKRWAGYHPTKTVPQWKEAVEQYLAGQSKKE